ncbi:hypothetical protein N7532_003485 [Penicillium argentinense]|uniref:DUF3824 domain-containing protein n=1 Tax=Penicillium argentinense TaxID=1131581 RepID=A0A9W9FMK1_9EURO|nr:uncharacterized protein N7532_003485 [Penicillium argentinense]KAJ5102956.1 hypothetical protein N7532_003485 [Penicillium argentinense]
MSYYRDSGYDDRPVTIKRYVIPNEEREDRREFSMSRDDPYGERKLVIHRNEHEVEYEPPARDYYERESSAPSVTHTHHRLSNHSGELSHHSHHTGEHLHHPHHPHHAHHAHHAHHTAEHLHMEHLHVSENRPGPRPGPLIIQEQPITIVQSARNVYASPRESDYDVVRRSDTEEDPYYYHHRLRVRDYDDRRRRELSPGDSISQASRRHHSDRDRDYSSDDSMVYVRKETRYEDEHGSHHKRHLAEGALVGAAGAELLRSRSKKKGEEVSHGMSHAMKTAGAGALGAVAVNAAGHARDWYRSKSRSRHRSHSFDDDRSHRFSHHSHSYHSSRGRHGRSRSRSRSHSHSRAKTLMELGLGAAAVAAGVAALRNNKNKDGERKSRSRTRSRSRGRALSSTRSEKGGDDARSESKRRQHMAGAGLAGAAVAGLVEHHRSRSRARKGERSKSHSRLRKALPVLAAGVGTAAATGFYEKKRPKKTEKTPSAVSDAGLVLDPAAVLRPKYKKHRSRSREIASAALGATGLGYAADLYSRHRDRSKVENERNRTRYDDVHRDPYEEHYDPEPYPPSPVVHPPPADNYYPNSNYFPPPPGSTPNLNATPQPYNPADYPPPPGAAPPPQPYSYGAPGPEPYAPRPRRADENVSASSAAQPQHVNDGVFSIETVLHHQQPHH